MTTGVNSKKIELPRICFVIEGGATLGFGHFVRTIQIAENIKNHSEGSVFFVVSDEQLKGRIEEKDISVFCEKGAHFAKDNDQRISEIIRKQNCKSVVIDIKHDHAPHGLLQEIKQQNNQCRTVLIDNHTSSRFQADTNIYPSPKELVEYLNWDGYQGQVYSGIEYFPIKNELVMARQMVKKEPGSLIVTMGASDPNGLTVRVMQAVAGMGKRVKVIIGPAVQQKRDIYVAAAAGDFEIYEDPSNFAEILASARMAVTALGISIYEMAYLGIKPVVIGNYQSDTKFGRILECCGFCCYAGFYEEMDTDYLRQRIERPGSSQVFDALDSDGAKRLAEITVNYGTDRNG